MASPPYGKISSANSKALTDIQAHGAGGPITATIFHRDGMNRGDELVIKGAVLRNLAIMFHECEFLPTQHLYVRAPMNKMSIQ